jgi:hypothetical protein
MVKLNYKEFGEIHRRFRYKSSIDILNECTEDGFIDININNDYIFKTCCENGYIDKVIQLLSIKDNNITLSVPNQGNYIFASVCQNGYIDIAKLLLDKFEKYININACNNTAFCNACKFGHVKTAEWLLSIGNINLNEYYGGILQDLCNDHNNDGRFITIKWLVQFINNKSNNEIKITNDKSIENINKCIHYYSSLGNIDMMKLLMENVDLYPEAKNVAFTIACIFDKFNLLKWLLNNKNLYTIDSFLLCCAFGHLDIMKIIYNKQPDIVNKNINQILMTTCRYGHLSIMEWLFDYPIYINNINACDNQAFFLACRFGHIKIAKELYVYDVIKINSKNNRAFVVACAFGHTDIAKWLLSLQNNDIVNDPIQRRIDYDNKYINIDECINFTFSLAYNNGFHDTAKWLSTLTTSNDHSYDKYVIDAHKQRKQSKLLNLTDKNKCDICCDNNSNYLLTCCSQILCKSCIDKIRSEANSEIKCPFCRTLLLYGFYYNECIYID